jgi:hypothetical protein
MEKAFVPSLFEKGKGIFPCRRFTLYVRHDSHHSFSSESLPNKEVGGFFKAFVVAPYSRN